MPVVHNLRGRLCAIAPFATIRIDANHPTPAKGPPPYEPLQENSAPGSYVTQDTPDHS